MGTNRQELLRRLQEAEEVRPVMEIDGQPLYTFEGALKLAEAELTAGKAGYEDTDLGIREMNPSGDTYPHSKKRNASIDPYLFFDNRYRKSYKQPGGKRVAVYEIVTDKRAIETQPTGRCWTENVVVYQVEVKKADGDKDAENVVELVGTKNIGSDEFIREFKQKLDIKAMQRILPLIHKAVHQTVVTPDALGL